MKTLLIAMIVMLSTVAQARNPIPQPTQAQVEWAKLTLADANATDPNKAAANLIMSRVVTTIQPVCNLPEKTDNVAFCAAPGDFTWKDRLDCIESATVGAPRIDATNAITKIIDARVRTKNMTHGVAKLPERPSSVVECLMGEFTVDQRQSCCNKLGLGSVLCGYASEIDSTSRDDAHKPVCL